MVSKIRTGYNLVPSMHLKRLVGSGVTNQASNRILHRGFHKVGGSSHSGGSTSGGAESGGAKKFGSKKASSRAY